jgi:hypothetical protein
MYILPRVSVGEQQDSKSLPSITISTSVKFSFRNMNGADPPRWRQNHPENQLPPHIITGIEHKHAVSLLPFIALRFYEYSLFQTPVLHSKPKLFDKFKGLFTPKRQSEVHEPVLPSVANPTENAQVCPSSRHQGIVDDTAPACYYKMENPFHRCAPSSG